MIFQCYFKREQEQRLFTSGPYVGFGLEPEVNPGIVTNCPELADPSTRTALVEYGAMLNVWRNQTFLGSDWVGFTSYRQLDKSPIVFNSDAHVRELLDGWDFIAWRVMWVAHLKLRARRHLPLLGLVPTIKLRGAAAQAEKFHPLLHSFTVDVLRRFRFKIPNDYYRAREVAFGNYWALRVTHFNEFMEWSWPIVQYALELEHPFKHYASSWNPDDDKRKAVGYFMERLFILWAMQRSLRGRRLNEF
jgi:hypothetical protein